MSGLKLIKIRRCRYWRTNDQPQLDDPMIQEIFAAAETLSLPVLFHMSPEVGYEYGIVDDAGLPLLEESLKKYPNLKFIGHSQPFWHEISGDASGDLSSVWSGAKEK